MRTVTTDRASANKVSWDLLEDDGLVGVPDAVHVHHSMVSDVLKVVKPFGDVCQEAYKVVDTFRKRPKLMSDWRSFQQEQKLKVLTLVKARQERLASKFYMCQRMLRLKKPLRAYVHKRRFKTQFAATLADRTIRTDVASAVKRPSFWKALKHTTKTLSPIVRSLRMSDARLQGKAGLLYPSLCRMKASCAKKLAKACAALVPEAEAPAIQNEVADKIGQRITDIDNDRVRAATIAHPRNLLKQKAEDDPQGPMHKLIHSCKPGFYKVARQHPLWGKVQNAVVEYMSQKGMWLDNALLKKSKELSLEAFWEEVAMAYNNPSIKTFMVDLLSYVIDSADSERLWAVFQNADPKGSKRSRLDFAHKNKEVGIAANMQLEKYWKKAAAPKSRRRLLKKTPSEAKAPIQEILDADLGGDSESADALEDGDEERADMEALLDLDDASEGERGPHDEDGPAPEDMEAASSVDEALEEGSDSD